jgi:hypothetical protein
MNVRRLFVASCLSLLTTSMVFAIRGDIEADLSAAFHLTKEQMGLIWGPAFWGFTLAIFQSGLIVDAVGMRALHVISSLGYIGGSFSCSSPAARRARHLDLRQHRHPSPLRRVPGHGLVPGAGGGSSNLSWPPSSREQDPEAERAPRLVAGGMVVGRLHRSS